MSAMNDPIEVTVDKRGNVIILIDRHNLSAAEVLDMAARAMLAAGYEKSQILQAALAYGGKYAAAKDQSPAAVVAAPAAEAEPSKAAPVETSEPLAQKTPVVPPPLPVVAPPLNETVAAESKALPILPALDKEPEKAEIKEIKESPVAAKIEETPPAAEKTDVLPEAIAPEPAPVSLEPVAELPVVAPVEVKPEPAPVAAVMPPALPKAPETPARIQPVVPVSVMGNVTEKTEDAEPAGKSSPSKMDEILAADRKRIQNLIAANAGAKPVSEPVPVVPVIPKVAAPPVAVMSKPETPEPEPAKETADANFEWQGQKFDPATSTSMLIPPMPGTFDDDDSLEPAAVVDVPISPPRTPKIPVSVVMSKSMAPPAADEAPPKLAPNVPPPPSGGPVSMLSRITGFVKLNTIAIPHYQAEAVESTINTPKPMTPSVLSPQAPPTPAKK